MIQSNLQTVLAVSICAIGVNIAVAADEEVPLQAGWDKGFYLKSADNDFRLNIGGWIQPRYEFESASGAEDTSSFLMRRARVDVRGHVFEDFTFRVMSEFARDANLRDAWINYQRDPLMQVRMGQFTVPFQWHRYIGPRRQHFAERGVPSEAFGAATGRDIGVMLHGVNDTRTWGYGMGVFNGEGRNKAGSDSKGNMASARLSWAALGELPREETDYRHSAAPGLAFGAGVQGATKNEAREWDLGRSLIEDEDEQNRRADWITGTIDASFRWQGFSVATDGYLRSVDPDAPGVDSYDGWAWMVTAGYAFIPEKWEIVGRYSELRLDRDDSDTEETEWGLGLTYYHRGHDLKSRINYFNHQTARGTSEVILYEWHLQF